MSATLSSLALILRRASSSAARHLAIAAILAVFISGAAWSSWSLFGFGPIINTKVTLIGLVLVVGPVVILAVSGLALLGLIKGLDWAVGFIGRQFGLLRRAIMNRLGIVRTAPALEPVETTTATRPAEPAPAVPATPARTAPAATPASAVAPAAQPTRAPETFRFEWSEKVLEFVRATGPLTMGVIPGIAAMLLTLHLVASMPVPQFTSSQHRGFEYLGSHPLGGFSPLSPAINWLGQHPVVANTLLALLALAALAGPVYLVYRLAMALYGVVLATAHRLGRFYASTSPVVRKAYRTTKSIVADVYRTSSDIEVLAGWVADLCRRELTKHYLPRVQSALLSSFLKHTSGQRHPRVAAALVACYEATRRVGNRLAVEPSQARHRRAHHLLPVPQPSFEHTVRELVGTGATAD